MTYQSRPRSIKVATCYWRKLAAMSLYFKTGRTLALFGKEQEFILALLNSCYVFIFLILFFFSFAIDAFICYFVIRDALDLS